MSIKKMVVIILVVIMSVGIFSGCRDSKTVVEPKANFSIDWETVVEQVKQTDMSVYGLYADEKNMLADAKDLGSISFYNYDPVNGDFRSVDYQLSINYGEAYKLEAGSNELYDVPTVVISYVNNNGKGSYSAAYDLSSSLLGEEGEWFLDGDKESLNKEIVEIVKKAIGE